MISIHALRVEGDLNVFSGDKNQRFVISIHALRVEGDSHSYFAQQKQPQFLSTPSGWRATAGFEFGAGNRTYFYPRPPGGGRPGFCYLSKPPEAISIHALRVEGD